MNEEQMTITAGDLFWNSTTKVLAMFVQVDCMTFAAIDLKTGNRWSGVVKLTEREYKQFYQSPEPVWSDWGNLKLNLPESYLQRIFDGMEQWQKVPQKKIGKYLKKAIEGASNNAPDADGPIHRPWYDDL